MGIAALFFVFLYHPITNRITVATPGPESPCLRILFPEQGGRVLVRIFRWSGGRAHVSGGGAFPRRPRAGCPGRIPAGIWRMGSSSVHTAARQPEALRRQARRKIFQSLRMERETSSRPEMRRKARTSPSSRAVNARRAARRIVAGSSRKASAPHCPRRARSLANRRRKPRPMRRNSSR